MKIIYIMVVWAIAMLLSIGATRVYDHYGSEELLTAVLLFDLGVGCVATAITIELME